MCRASFFTCRPGEVDLEDREGYSMNTFYQKESIYIMILFIPQGPINDYSRYVPNQRSKATEKCYTIDYPCELEDKLIALEPHCTQVRRHIRPAASVYIQRAASFEATSSYATLPCFHQTYSPPTLARLWIPSSIPSVQMISLYC